MKCNKKHRPALATELLSSLQAPAKKVKRAKKLFPKTKKEAAALMAGF